MTIYKFTNGTAADATQVNAVLNDNYTVTGLNMIRSLIDRSAVWSAGMIDWWGDAYIDSNGREDSVDTSASSATFDSVNKKYIAVETVSDETWNGTQTLNGDVSDFTTNVVMNAKGFFSMILIRAGSTGGSKTVDIKVGGDTLATKTFTLVSNTNLEVDFTMEDYTRLIESGETVAIVFTANSGNVTNSSSVSYNGTLFDITSQFTTFGDNTTPTNMMTFVEIDVDEETVEMDIPSETFSSTISKAIGVPLIEDWEDGANIQYKLTGTGGAEDTGWLDAMDSSPEISTFTAFTAEPDTLIVKLVPKTTSPTAGYPSIRGFVVRCTE